MDNDDLLAKTQDWYKKSKQECIENPDGFYTSREGWSVSQREAIHAELAMLMGLSSVAFQGEVDGDLVKSLINQTMSAIEAIASGKDNK